MSTLPLSIDRLAEVRETLKMSQFWSLNGKEFPLGLAEVLLGGESRRADKIENAASEFVHLAYIFNCHGYFKGKKVNDEPLAWSDALRVIDTTDRRRLGICQFLKSLQCIDYNTDVEGWLTQEQYENWGRREQYEKFKKTLDGMINYLALHIIHFDSEEYKAAKWS